MTPPATASATPATINVIHRARRGLTFTANYTYAKSIDTASSAGGDKNILTPVGGQVGGQVVFGGTRANDRSVSTYDQRHVIHGTVIYDLPFGKGRQFLNNVWKPLDFLLGGWTITGLVRLQQRLPLHGVPLRHQPARRLHAHARGRTSIPACRCSIRCGAAIARSAPAASRT